MLFLPRFVRPEPGNKYYIRKASGGYNGAVKGSPTDPDCDVLPNCVGYAVGRFNEIGGWESCRYLKPVNAEQFMNHTIGLETGQTPRLGACMVWRGGGTLSSLDGPGHVAIVEKVISSTEIVTSESAYGGAAFKTRTRKRGADGNWEQGGGFRFLGFIYNPAVKKEDVMTGEEIYNALNEYLSTQRIPDWAKKEFQEAVDAGITDGSNPMQLIPRYQACIMAKRAMQK